jgi:hypothetical protein
MQLVVTRRTVTIERLEKKDLARVKYEEVKIGNDTHYLNCVSDEKSVKINVMGGWSPLTGDVELYHYDENSFKDSHNISAKYLDWTYDEKEKKYIAPAAKN